MSNDNVDKSVRKSHTTIPPTQTETRTKNKALQYKKIFCERSIAPPVLPGLDEVAGTWLTVATEDGTKVPEGPEARHELAASLAAELEEGALVLTVAFPANEQLCGLRLVTS